MANISCPNCRKTAKSWSKFKDLKMREGIGLALCGSVINGFDHFMCGESRSQNQKPDYRTTELYHCDSCKKYFLRCPGCKSYIKLDSMPNETRTLCSCTRCHKKVLYAEEDYTMGGG